MYRFIGTCETLGDNDGGLTQMVDEARQIKRRAFLRWVDHAEQSSIERRIGYEGHYRQGLIMARDWHVSYHRGRLRGRRVVFFTWSAIEFVFEE